VRDEDRHHSELKFLLVARTLGRSTTKLRVTKTLAKKQLRDKLREGRHWHLTFEQAFGLLWLERASKE
jgi:hypothetical protein